MRLTSGRAVRRLMAAACVAAACLLGTSEASAQRRMPPKIPVFVKVATNPDGWTDLNKDRSDSVKDIARHLASDSRKWVRLADTEAAAEVVVIVLERHMEEDDDLHVVTGRVVVKDVEMPASGRSGSSWGEASRNLALQLDTWVGENRERIVAKRATPTP